MRITKVTLTSILALTIIFTQTMTASKMKLEGSIFGYSSNASTYTGRIAIDDEQNIYIAGETKGSFDQVGYGYGYNTSGFLLKFDAETHGEYEWARIFGSTSVDTAYGIGVDDDDNILVAGTTYGSVGGQTNAGLADGYLVKYDSEGSNLWTRQWGSSTNDYAENLSVDEEDNVYVVGRTFGSFDGETHTGNADAFIVKFDSDGEKLWTKIWGATSAKGLRPFITYYDEARDVDTDDDGNVYVAGQTEGNINGVTNIYGYAAFLSKLDEDGVHQWTKIWGSGTGSTDVASFGVDSDDGIIAVVGQTGGDIGSKTNSGGTDAFIRVFDEDGEVLWTDVWGSDADDQANDVNLEESIYVAGQTMGYFDGDATVAPLGAGYGSAIAANWNAFVSEFDGEDEERVWSRIWGSTNTEFATGIAINDAENILVAGHGDGAFHSREQDGLFYAFVTMWTWLDNAADFDGDGRDDLTIFDSQTGFWYIFSSANTNAIQFGTQWGWAGARPVAGDFDGDGVNDMAVFDDESGAWYIQSVEGSLITWGTQWGWRGAKPVHGDYDGDGADDLAVFDDESGAWYIANANGESIHWGTQWGWPGAKPVPGDFDGDDRDDLAVFDDNSGSWYILSTQGRLITWATQWGWAGAEPVSGDYDGDGEDDLAVFDTENGYWYVMSVSGRIITWAQQWGWAGAEPVSGDYDGDGADDLAVFDQNSGYWYVMSAQGKIIHWAQQWGWPGAEPVAAD